MSEAITVEITGGATASVPYIPGMNARQALEGAYDAINSTETFTYAVQYYGRRLGYLVAMVNETYDTFISTSQPFFYWQFLVNGTPATTGIDATVLQPGDRITFSFERFVPQVHAGTILEAKFLFQTTGRRP